uniref:PB2 n=2 Tax=root TaxID=1 RepID=A0A3G1PW34_9ORTO|nr:PB2 [Photinus pyralis orthomyxo-like virus 2]
MEKKKEYLMMKLKKVLAASSRTIDKARRMKMYNLKLIERSSKCVKDPNPLGTAMGLMGTKYPLVLRRRDALKQGMPKSLIAPSKGESEDRHRHGWTLCRKEAVDWWVSSSEVPNEESIEVINLLYKNSRNEVHNYYQMNWERASIQWGHVILERRIVPTRDPIANVPKSLREHAVKQILFRDYTLPSYKVTTTTLESLRDFMNMSLSSKVALSKQIRVLLNELDPRERCLPVTSGMEAGFSPLKHALTHTNFVVTGYEYTPSTRSLDVRNTIRKFLRCMIFEAKLSKLSITAMLSILDETKIHGTGIDELITLNPIGETMEGKFYSALIGKSETLEYTIRELTVCPTMKRAEYTKVANTTGRERLVHSLPMTYNFKFRDLRGKFTTCRTYIMSIICNYTTATDLTTCLIEIATFCSRLYSETKGRTDKEVREEIMTLNRKDVWSIANIKEEEKKMLKDYHGQELSIGRLTLTDGIEYMGTGTTQLKLTGEYNVVAVRENYTIACNVSQRDIEPFTTDITCPSPWMINHYDFQRTMENRVSFFMDNMPIIIEKVAQSDFCWKNNHLNKFLIPIGPRISYVARYFLSKMQSTEHIEPAVFSFYYALANRTPDSTQALSKVFTLRTGHVIDIDAESGIMVHDSAKRRYLLFGSDISGETSKLDNSRLMCGLLPGFRISSNPDPSKPLRSIRYLDDRREVITEGKEYRTYICGRLHGIVKDSTITYQIKSTFDRHLMDSIQRLSSSTQHVLYSKRSWLQGLPLEDEVVRPSKRSKMDETEYTLPEEDPETLGIMVDEDWGDLDDL